VGEPAAAIEERANNSVTVAAISEEAAIPEILSSEPLSAAIKGTLPFIVACILQVLTYWSVDIVTPATPHIKDDLALTATGAGLIFSLFFAGRLLSSFPAAYLVERVGTVATAAGGGVLIALGSLACAVANGEALLFPARAVQGAGIALVVCASLVSMMRSKPDRGAAVTYFGFSSTVGSVVALVTGGVLTELLGWRGVFAFTVLLGLGIVVAAVSSRSRLVMSGPPRRATSSQDEEQEHLPFNRPLYISVLSANFLGFFNYFVWVGVALYADKKFNASSGEISFLLLVVTLVHLFAAFPAGRIIRLRGGRKSLIAGLIMSVIGTFLILVPTDAIWLALPLIPYGCGQVLSINAASDLVLHLGGQSKHSIGMLRVSGDIGLVVGPFVSGRLMDALGYGTPFAILPLITIGAALYFWRGIGRFGRSAMA
jgi:MFS family permease